MTTRNPLQRWYAGAPATMSIVGLLVAVYVLTAVDARSLGNNLDGPVGQWMGLYPPAMQGWGLLKAATGVLAHDGPAHLLFNSFMLYLVGAELERLYSHRMVAWLFVAGGLGASAFIVWLSPYAVTVGASGAVFALLGVLLVVRLHNRSDYQGLLVLIGVNVVYTLLPNNVSVWGHFGGLITGVVMGLVIVRSHRGALWVPMVVTLVAAAACVAGAQVVAPQVVTGGWL